MPTYYDDNFGHYNIESEEDVDFYFQMQRESVSKRCSGCGRTVRLRPDYGYCNTCATTLERGGDLPGYDGDDDDVEEEEEA
jgi:hypothetical protein